MNNKERETKKKELYKKSWEKKWKHYKKPKFNYLLACPFCHDYNESDLREECLIDSDLCGCHDDDNLFESICEEEDREKQRELIEKMALEIKKRGEVDKHA